MNPINIPYWISADGVIPSSPGKGTLPGATLDSVLNANWAVVRALSTNGPPGASALFAKRPCVFWYGEEYPFSSLYERDPGVSGVLVRDRYGFFFDVSVRILHSHWEDGSRLSGHKMQLL